jgi:3-methylfumaryl-CoA hydratase
MNDQFDIDNLQSWIGREEVAEDEVTPVPIAALAATLDRDDPKPRPGDELPPLWHWLYFLPIVRQSELGADGHPKRGGFLPPVPLPRRMWAGARFEFHQPVRVGDSIVRKSTIADVSTKEGRSGPLIFLLVRHEVAGPAGLAILEEHDIVYSEALTRGQTMPSPRAAAPTGAVYRRDIHVDEVMLFRYSALIFVGHRIHYDRRYATEVEGLSRACGAWAVDRHVAGGPAAPSLQRTAEILPLSRRGPAVRQCPVRGLRHARTERQGKSCGRKMRKAILL